MPVVSVVYAVEKMPVMVVFSTLLKQGENLSLIANINFDNYLNFHQFQLLLHKKYFYFHRQYRHYYCLARNKH